MIISVRNVVYFDYNAMAFKVTGYSHKFDNSTLASDFINSLHDS
jgi:hypothetical protein